MERLKLSQTELDALSTAGIMRSDQDEVKLAARDVIAALPKLGLVAAVGFDRATTRAARKLMDKLAAAADGGVILCC